MKKALIFGLMVGLFIPAVSYAAWYNIFTPWTWFQKKPVAVLHNASTTAPVAITATIATTTATTSEKKIEVKEKSQPKPSIKPKTDQLSDVELKTVLNEINFINSQIAESERYISLINQKYQPQYTYEVIATLNAAIANLKSIKMQYLEIFNDVEKNPNNGAIYRARINEINKKYELLVYQDNAKSKDAIDRSVSMMNSDRERQAYQNYSSQIQERQRQADQAYLDALNAKIDQYNAIRKNGSENGLTETVVNNQLNAAGFGKTTYCNSQPNGLGGYSVTCH